MTKLKPIDELAAEIKRLRAEGKTVAHCHGVFDVLHVGHVRHLKAAKQLGDVLVVSLTADRFVNKGPGRPAFNQILRAEMVGALDVVDYVAINEEPHAVNLIKKLGPNIYVKGSDYVRPEDDPTGMITAEKEAVASVGGRMQFTDEIVFSSSALINKHFDIFPPATQGWLDGFRERHSLDEVLSYLDKAARLNGVVIGEPIVDEYVFCEAMGKATKDPMIASLFQSMESYAGGSLAVANHLAGVINRVDLVGEIGELERREDFMRSRLSPGVTPYFMTRAGAPTIHKRRFVDHYTQSRLFELYMMRDGDAQEHEVAALEAVLRARLTHADIAVVADYGHGMIADSLALALGRESKFLALNVQANAGNRGLNTIRRYGRADYVCLAMHEVVMETRERNLSVEQLVPAMLDMFDCDKFTVTRGRLGTLHFDREGNVVQAPALAGHVVDRVGAGDALLSVTSPLVAVGAPWEIVGFLGNIAGGILVSDLGNRLAIGRASIVKAATALLK
jgi:rfaE bifunctional protein nucleotidyltransferase chain/domain